MVRLANMQALVVRGTAKPLYAVALFRLGDPSLAAAFLRNLLPSVTPGDSGDSPGVPLLNVFVSWRAVSSLLGHRPQFDPEAGRRQLEPSFVDPGQGPDALADQLGFVGKSDPAGWWTGFSSGDIDLAIYIACDDEGQRTQRLAVLRAAAGAGGWSELTVPSFLGGVVSGYRPPGGRLHFGYRDGITAPQVDWDDEGRPGAVNLREFVLGYWSADYPTAPYAKGPWQDFVRDGSFACLTWIRQDVAEFEAFLSRYAPVLSPPLNGIDPKEWLAARLMGRWRDGTPLARYPDGPPSGPDPTDRFGYGDDPAGVRCPLDAHIRVVNCRDQPLSFANTSRFPKGPPRLIRRGFSYGERLDGPSDDGKDRGLFGVFLCARINEQFYTILRWMQQTDFSDSFDEASPGRSGQDRLTGSRLPGGANRTPDPTIVVGPAVAPTTLSLSPFITYRGVSVLFAPSLAALSELAA